VPDAAPANVHVISSHGGVRHDCGVSGRCIPYSLIFTSTVAAVALRAAGRSVYPSRQRPNACVANIILLQFAAQIVRPIVVEAFYTRACVCVFGAPARKVNSCVARRGVMVV